VVLFSSPRDIRQSNALIRSRLRPSKCFLMDQSLIILSSDDTRESHTKASKTAVMDVTSFLYVSLGSSTVQLHDSLGSRRACACSEAGFRSQIGDRA
jgi:hypothetical protein